MDSIDSKLITLKGNKRYLPVAWRLVWAIEECPDLAISTTLLSHDAQQGSAVFRASVVAGNRQASAHGSETRTDFPDYLEKAETKAIGRALAMIGYGTQFAIDLDEGASRLADAPLDAATPTPAPAAAPATRRQAAQKAYAPTPPPPPAPTGTPSELIERILDLFALDEDARKTFIARTGTADLADGLAKIPVSQLAPTLLWMQQRGAKRNNE